MYTGMVIGSDSSFLSPNHALVLHLRVHPPSLSKFKSVKEIKKWSKGIYFPHEEHLALSFSVGIFFHMKIMLPSETSKTQL
jgi:hypothetical protein